MILLHCKKQGTNCKDSALDTNHWKALENAAQEIAVHKARCGTECLAIVEPQKDIDDCKLPGLAMLSYF